MLAVLVSVNDCCWPVMLFKVVCRLVRASYGSGLVADYRHERTNQASCKEVFWSEKMLEDSNGYVKFTFISGRYAVKSNDMAVMRLVTEVSVSVSYSTTSRTSTCRPDMELRMPAPSRRDWMAVTSNPDDAMLSVLKRSWFSMQLDMTLPGWTDWLPYSTNTDGAFSIVAVKLTTYENTQTHQNPSKPIKTKKDTTKWIIFSKTNPKPHHFSFFLKNLKIHCSSLFSYFSF